MKCYYLMIPFALLSSTALSAASFDEFGALPEATFNPTGEDSGIPNDAVAISNFETNFGTGTLGLSAAQRFDSPTVTNDGAGTFFASPGVSDSDGSQVGLSTWNMNFYISFDQAEEPVPVGTTNDEPTETPGVGFQLSYDIDPGSGSDIGVIDIPLEVVMEPGVVENSWNLGFDFMNLGADGVTPPDGLFDPYAEGSYDLGLAAVTETGRPLATSSINVQVGEVAEVPVPATLWVFITGLGILGGFAGGVRARAQGK